MLGVRQAIPSESEEHVTILQILMACAVLIGITFFILWCVSLVRRDASIVDVFWGLGFVLVAWLSMAISGGSSSRHVVLVALVTLWGLRLSAYLWKRNWGKPEDHRYQSMRKRHGKWFPIVSLVTVFGLQGLVMWVVSLPVQVAALEAEGWTWTATAGVAVWLVGLFFESVGDYQLARFKADPAHQGQVMDRGLWRYTRHPNYFGDFLVWWGHYLVAADERTWWWTIAGPVVMSWLLVRVSGVRMLDRSLSQRVGGYREYMRRTSAFFPLPPKRPSRS